MEEKHNEWHQQVDFSSQYFRINEKCRYYQSIGDLENWKGVLEAKLSLAVAISEKEKIGNDLAKETINKFRIILRNSYSNYSYQRNISLNTLKTIKRISPTFYKTKEEFITTLEEVEGEIDIFFNRLMPLLNLKGEDSIMGL